MIRVTASIAGLLVAFAAGLGGYLLFLAAKGQLAVAERFYLYGWIAGGLGALASLFMCSLKLRWLTGRWAGFIVLLSIGLPFLRWYDVNDNLARVLRYVVFFGHLPAAALTGVLVSMLLFRRLSEEYG